MSKSYNNYIALSDEPALIRKKVASMFTDPKRIKRNDPGHPDVCNVFDYYSIFVQGNKKNLEIACRKAEIGCTDCKKELAEAIVQFLAPIQEKRNSLLKNKKHVIDILALGREKAQRVASATLYEVKDLLHLPR